MHQFSHSFAIEGRLLESLRALTSGRKIGLFEVLAAVLDVLLFRYTGSEDIVVCWRNTEARTLRVKLPDDPAYLDLLARGRVEMPDMGTNVAAPTVLLLLNSAADANDRLQYDLIFEFLESADGLRGICENNGNFLRHVTAETLTKHFEALLRDAVARPLDRISTFEMFDPAEKHRILVEWNGEDRGYPDLCIHELIEQQVERTPDSVALVFGDRRLTYRELNNRANQLAHYLRGKETVLQMPVGAVPIGILMDASLEVLVAVIAILKAGGAYVALDQKQPAHRLREVLREGRFPLVLTTASTAAHADIADEVELVFLDREAARIAAESEANPRSGVTPGDLAFVRYTSGSTGKPKGAMGVHRSITSRLSLPLPDFDATDVYLINTSVGFGSKLFYPLVMGATVVAVREDQVRDATRLAERIEHHGVTGLFMVTSHLRQLLSLGPEISHRLRSLRRVTVGGEILTADLAARFRELLPQARLWNTYGGSEVGGTATMQLIDEESLADGNSIGRPIVNTRVYLLDRDRNPVPPGVTGEIYVGSGHMSTGYWNRPDLTEPRFMPDPFRPGSGDQLYRTGDLGRDFPDGRIEYLGRADRQVKVRGFRVELEEIEVALQHHPRVDQVVVAAQKTGTDNRLVGYVVFKPGARPGVSELQEFLRQRVREYMVPYAFVFLETMPVNARGKVDTQALPPPGKERPAIANVYEAPRNAEEAAIAEIWAGVLGIEAVGINDNFVELGGDSLLATAVSARLRRRLGLDVPMELILEWSIATIARETAAAE